MSLDNHPEALRAWRLAERKRLVAQRMALDAPTRAYAQTQFDQQLSALLATHAGGVLGLCWPFRHEHDARHLASRWRARGGIGHAHRVEQLHGPRPGRGSGGLPVDTCQGPRIRGAYCSLEDGRRIARGGSQKLSDKCVGVSFDYPDSKRAAYGE